MKADSFIERQATALLNETTADALGQSTPSVYESARLVADAPWLDGHTRRLKYLCERQNPDGTWGLGQHGLVPTLSAAEALLTVLARGDDVRLPRPQLVNTTALAVTRLSRLLGDHLRPPVLPDTVAAPLIVPALIDRIHQHLGRCARSRPPFLLPWASSVLFVRPQGCAPAALDRLRTAVYEGRPLPEKLWHSWEILAPASEGPTPYLRPHHGALGCSPAATAAWLNQPAHRASRPAGIRYLRRVQTRYGGPVPGTAPSTPFERAHILGLSARHGVPHTPPAALLAELRGALGETGAAAGPGLPPDAGTTAAVLYALGHHGQQLRPESLLPYFTDDHFCCYPDERTVSTSTNAHALEALARYAARHPADRRRYRCAIRRTIDWLLAQQHPDGSWSDKWHASPYYATACCSRALAAYAGPVARPALARAAVWALSTRLPTGRWGRDGTAGTAEETAYAAWILLGRPPRAGAARHALTTARRILQTEPVTDHVPALWHDKDVYAPVRILRATRLAALHTLFHLPNCQPPPS
ncbi:prenyltransferase [Streptomyces sp. WAC 06783]|uniref:prenyltransferase/squalene oxidase repeat-containing protein n=1 Tax=Streptomyces sp. WAC 06783 TaxID=2203211 RepID=UPI000F737397|nr:prenyltransferase/squalene oxidase repeat-containing protein [Streptomyces sp. WAC 06783]RSO06931.1 prenyltransferase [Streptomyces sp. WAC 06783]